MIRSSIVVSVLYFFWGGGGGESDDLELDVFWITPGTVLDNRQCLRWAHRNEKNHPTERWPSWPSINPTLDQRPVVDILVHPDRIEKPIRWGGGGGFTARILY